MADFETEYIKGKTIEQLIGEMATPASNPPGSLPYEAKRLAIAAMLAERLAAPRRWAMIAAIAAAISAAAAVVSAVAAF